jgi:hypothetical protein
MQQVQSGATYALAEAVWSRTAFQKSRNESSDQSVAKRSPSQLRLPLAIANADPPCHRDRKQRLVASLGDANLPTPQHASEAPLA